MDEELRIESAADKDKKLAGAELVQAQPHLAELDKKFGFDDFFFDWFGLNMKHCIIVESLISYILTV